MHDELQYATTLQEHWRANRPQDFARIPPAEREAFFARKGQEMASAIEELALQLEGPAPEDETYLQRVGRLNEARTQAWETVLAQMTQDV